MGCRGRVQRFPSTINVITSKRIGISGEREKESNEKTRRKSRGSKQSYLGMEQHERMGTDTEPGIYQVAVAAGGA